MGQGMHTKMAQTACSVLGRILGVEVPQHCVAIRDQASASLPMQPVVRYIPPGGTTETVVDVQAEAAGAEPRAHDRSWRLGQPDGAQEPVPGRRPLIPLRVLD